MLLYREVKCVENDEMCGFCKFNYKILDKNLTIVILYREVKCVENDEMCGFEKFNYKILDKNWTIVLLYREVEIMCGKRWNVRIWKVQLQNIG